MSFVQFGSRYALRLYNADFFFYVRGSKNQNVSFEQSNVRQCRIAIIKNWLIKIAQFILPPFFAYFFMEKNQMRLQILCALRLEVELERGNMYSDCILISNLTNH